MRIVHIIGCSRWMASIAAAGFCILFCVPIKGICILNHVGYKKPKIIYGYKSSWVI